MSRGSHRSKGMPNRLENGLGRPAYPLSGSPRSHLSRVDSSHLLEFLSFTIAPLLMLLSWRYLRGKDTLLQNRPLFQVICPGYLWTRDKRWLLSRVQRSRGDRGLLSRVEPPTGTKGPPFVPVGGSTRDKRSNPFYPGW